MFHSLCKLSPSIPEEEREELDEDGDAIDSIQRLEPTPIQKRLGTYRGGSYRGGHGDITLLLYTRGV